MDRIAEGRSKNNGDHSGGEFLALFGKTFFISNLRYLGGLGPGLYATKPLSNFIRVSKSENFV